MFFQKASEVSWFSEIINGERHLFVKENLKIFTLNEVKNEEKEPNKQTDELDFEKSGVREELEDGQE